MATLAIPKFGMRVLAETPEPPAREPVAMPAFAPVSRLGDLVGKERTENLTIFGVRPIPPKSGYFFCAA
jgi:hypothetical protein